MTPPLRTYRSAGFTLMELMIVMTLLAIMTAAVTPVFRGTLTSVRAENEARDLVAMLEYAQARAITDAVEYRVYIAPTLNSYWLERAQMRNGRVTGFQTVTDQVVERTTLSTAAQLVEPRARRQGAEALYYVAFYPNGMSDEALLGIFDLEDETTFLISTEGSQVRWAEEAST